jgi:hypothetical protein
VDQAALYVSRAPLSWEGKPQRRSQYLLAGVVVVMRGMMRMVYGEVDGEDGDEDGDGAGEEEEEEEKEEEKEEEMMMMVVVVVEGDADAGRGDSGTQPSTATRRLLALCPRRALPSSAGELGLEGMPARPGAFLHLIDAQTSNRAAFSLGTSYPDR